MSYAPSFRLGDVHSKWEVSERREFSVPPIRLDAIVRDAIIAVTSVEPVREGDLWRAILPMSDASLFSLRDLVVTVRPHDDGSDVVATMTFDASSGKVAAGMWLVSTIGGIPILLAWRGVSIRNARHLAKTTLEALWTTIARSGGDVYR